jgi:hypothetical protein
MISVWYLGKAGAGLVLRQIKVRWSDVALRPWDLITPKLGVCVAGTILISLHLLWREDLFAVNASPPTGIGVVDSAGVDIVCLASGNQCLELAKGREHFVSVPVPSLIFRRWACKIKSKKKSSSRL